MVVSRIEKRGLKKVAHCVAFLIIKKVVMENRKEEQE